MRWVLLAALAALALLVLVAGTAQAQVTATVTMSTSSVDQVRGTAPQVTVTVRVANVGVDVETSTVTLSAPGMPVTLGQPSGPATIGAGSTRDYVGTVTLTQGGSTTGSQTILVAASVTGQNATGAAHSASVSGSFLLNRRNELVVAPSPSLWIGFGPGQTQTFGLQARDPHNGWRTTGIQSLSAVSCSPSIAAWSPYTSWQQASISSSGEVQLGYVTITSPSSLSPDAISPTGAPWRETTITCGVTVQHDATHTPSPTVPTFTLAPFFGGTALPGPQVNASPGLDAQAELQVRYANRRASPVTFTVSPASSHPQIAFAQTSYSVTVGAQSTATLRIPVTVADDVPEGRWSVSLSAQVLAGSLLESQTMSTSLEVVRPVQLDLSAPTSVWPRIVPGQRVELPIRAGERWGWKDVAVASARVTCPADMADWSPSLAVDRATVGKGAAAGDFARLVVTAPTTLDARLWRGATRTCAIDVVSNGHGAGVTGTTTLGVTLDPALPAALAIETDAAPEGFRFDLSRVGADPVYRQPFALRARNWGEEAYAGNVSFALAGSCVATWVGQGIATIPHAPAGTTPPAVPLAGELVVDARQPEGACATNVTAGTPLLGVRQPFPTFPIRHGATIVVQERLEFGEVPIGDTRALPVQVTETLGYARVPIDLVVEAVGDASGLAPRVDPVVTIVPGETQTFLVTFNPRAGAAACELAWDLRWQPRDPRPGLAPATTRVTAKTTIVGVDEVIAHVDRLQLPDDEILRMLERFRDEGCGIGDGAEQELYANVYDAASRLESALAAPASADVVADAANVAAVAQRLEAYAGSAPVFAKLQPANERLRERVLQQVEASIQGTPPAHALFTANVACELVEGDCAAIAQRYEQTLAAEKAQGERANAALEALFDLRVGAGFEVVDGFPVNANPWGWVEVLQTQKRLEEETATALATFGDIPPIEQRVRLAHDEAAASLATARRGLLAGAVVDAVLVLALAGGAAALSWRYRRDRAELALGHEYVG